MSVIEVGLAIPDTADELLQLWGISDPFAVWVELPKICARREAMTFAWQPQPGAPSPPPTNLPLLFLVTRRGTAHRVRSYDMPEKGHRLDHGDGKLNGAVKVYPGDAIKITGFAITWT